MIVVETRTSISPLMNSTMMRSRSFLLICPSAKATVASGTSFAMRPATSAISETRL